MFDLSLDQAQAFEAIKEWFYNQEADLNGDTGDGSGAMRQQIFRLFGYAGTGKTTLIRHFMEALKVTNSTRFAAYTGKAAMVMRKTGLPATTIHSLIYEVVLPNEEICKNLLKKMNAETDVEKKGLLKAQLNEASQVHFQLRDKANSDLRKARLLVLDECSMVNNQMLVDLLSFNVPMLVLGDPGQLPPAEGEGALTKAKPDVTLTEIHRQAQGNPIIDFATRARNGIYIARIALGTSSHCAQASLTVPEVLSFDQIITGKNQTRKVLNQRVRSLKGIQDVYPTVGERLICLKNDAENGLFNGMICYVEKVGELMDTYILLTIRRETDAPDAKPIEVKALRAHFEVYQDKNALENVRWWEKLGTNEFDFGYAITVHKAQGSQWDKVLLWDDKMFVGWGNKKDRPKWLYTGITRAIESITIASA